MRDYFNGTFEGRFQGAMLVSVMSNSFDISLLYAEFGDNGPRWYVAIGNEAGAAFTASETRTFAKRLVRHAKKVGFGGDVADEWAKDLRQVAAECDGRNEHGILPEHVQRPV